MSAQRNAHNNTMLNNDPNSSVLDFDTYNNRSVQLPNSTPYQNYHSQNINPIKKSRQKSPEPHASEMVIINGINLLSLPQHQQI